MKRTFTLLCAVCFMLTAHSQSPVLNQSNSSPVIGSVIPFYSTSAMSISSEILTTTGANVTWDLADETGSTIYNLSIVQPAGTAYASMEPTATVAMVQPGGAVDYYAINASGVERVGTYFTSNYYVNFQNNARMINFPFSYGSTFQDTYNADINFFGEHYPRNGQISGIADGYGTLILPWGEINNVLRVKLTENGTDVYRGESMPYSQTVYVFYHPGAQYYLATLTVDQNYMYMGAEVVGVFEDMDKDIHLAKPYPNPANDAVNIPVSNSTTHGTISVHNHVGQLVMEEALNQNLNAANTYRLNTANFVNGLYTVTVKEDDRIQSYRIVIAH